MLYVLLKMLFKKAKVTRILVVPPWDELGNRTNTLWFFEQGNKPDRNQMVTVMVTSCITN